MKELGLDLAEVGTFFTKENDDPYVLLKVDASRAVEWTELLGVPARRCYISDGRLRSIVEVEGHSHRTVVEAVLPPKGSVMAGDYGEIVAALYLASCAHPDDVLEPKMWRLKAGRTKPSQGSDVVQFYLPRWPASSAEDRVVCAEVKTKSTGANSTPVAAALTDVEKDRKSRLANTLAWLRERAILGDTTTVKVAHLERFIKADEHPPATFGFRAVAVISSEFIEEELADEVLAGVTLPPKDECALIVISMPDLKANYEKLYELLLASAAVGVEG